jgi:hypothetical protein
VLENIVPRSVHGVSVRFSVETDSQNYTISHSNGVIQPGKKQELTISFNTDEAKVQVALIVIKLAELTSTQELTRSLKVSAIGKYPFITINQEVIDFEELLVGKTCKKEITITNSSPVPTSFKIECESDDGKDMSLQLSHSEGMLVPNGTSTIVVTYTPQI